MNSCQGERGDLPGEGKCDGELKRHHPECFLAHPRRRVFIDHKGTEVKVTQPEKDVKRWPWNRVTEYFDQFQSRIPRMLVICHQRAVVRQDLHGDTRPVSGLTMVTREWFARRTSHQEATDQ